jgi:hypothetical protein
LESCHELVRARFRTEDGFCLVLSKYLINPGSIVSSVLTGAHVQIRSEKDRFSLSKPSTRVKIPGIEPDKYEGTVNQALAIVRLCEYATGEAGQ